MANQKISDLRRMTPGELAVGDLFAVVDVSEPTSPTGENKQVTVEDFAKYVHDNYTPSGSRFIYTVACESSVNGPTLPPTYVLTSVICKTSGQPIISVGTSNIWPSTGDSVTGSFNDNRVYKTQCVYDVNYLEVSNYGAVHHLQSTWIQFHSSSECPCTFSFEGFTRG